MKKKKKKTSGSVFKTIVFIVVGCSVLFGFMFWNLSPLFVEIRHTFVYSLVVKLVFTAAMFVLAFVPFFEVPLYGKIFLIFNAVLLWTVLFLSARVSVTVVFFASSLQLLADLAFYLLSEKAERDKKSCKFKSPATAQVIVGALLLLSAIVKVLDVEYIYVEFPFWIPALVAAGIAVSIALWVVIKKKEWFKQKQDRIWTPICALLFAFLAVWMSANVLNYSLETSSPQTVRAELLEKNIRSGARTPTTYEFEILVEGEEEPRTLTVPQYIYYHTEETDIIEISVYAGAFRVAYYIWE